MSHKRVKQEQQTPACRQFSIEKKQEQIYPPGPRDYVPGTYPDPIQKKKAPNPTICGSELLKIKILGSGLKLSYLDPTLQEKTESDKKNPDKDPKC